MEHESKTQELERLRQRIQVLEQELAQDAYERTWPPRKFYTTYHALAGFGLGMIGALTSLVFNIIGGLIFLPPEKGPLWLIRIYLTVPFGDAVIPGEYQELAPGTLNLALAMGCILYLFTGSVLGMPVHLILKRWFDKANFLVKFGAATGLGLALWIINFYGILSWLQPLLLGGNWIVQLTPPWVAALTHLVFTWTILLAEPLGSFVPYQHPGEVK